MIITGIACTDAVCEYGGSDNCLKVMPGAFTPLPKSVPLLRSHKEQIGVVEELTFEDGRLCIVARTDVDVTAKYLSVGFRQRNSVKSANHTLVYEAQLLEVSCVDRPANVECRITSITADTPMHLYRDAAMRQHDAMIQVFANMQKRLELIKELYR